jgi:putative restriction endonuclease
MNIYIAATDNRWFENLRYMQAEEVNFWVPGKTISLPRLQPGELLLFKLHSPRNFITGGGIFAHSSVYPVSLAWQAFTELNGAGTERELRDHIEQYRGKEPPHEDYDIGCVILSQPFFWEEDKWIPSDKYWRAGTRKYKKYDLLSEVGKQLWDEVQTRLRARVEMFAEPRSEEHKERYGPEIRIRPRLGQGAFRVIVTDAYKRRCAVTQERVLPTLEAAHIKPYAESGPHDIGNGILLRSDIHHLLDSGYVTISPDYHFEVSKRIKEDFDNGEEYNKLHGSRLYLPTNTGDRPDKRFIEWHNENRYKK